MRFYLKITYLLLVAFCFSSTASAAITVRLNGAIDGEVYSSPENGYIAGTRYKLYSILESPGVAHLWARVVALYQNDEEIQEFRESGWIPFTPQIEWANVTMEGELFRNGPTCTLNFGHLVAEYSPYLMWLTDDFGGDFPTPKPRGVGFEGLTLGNVTLNGLCAWKEQSVADNNNTLALSLNTGLKNGELQLIYVNTGKRVATAPPPQIAYQVNLKENLGRLSLEAIAAASTTTNNVMANIVDSTLTLSMDNYKAQVGYRNYDPNFDTLYRLRTPEFDPQTGKYLGWNPVDQYAGLRGIQFVLEDAQENNFHISFEKYFNSVDDSYLTRSIYKYNLNVFDSEVKLKKKVSTIYKSSFLKIPDITENTIDEVRFERKIKDSSTSFLTNLRILSDGTSQAIERSVGLKGTLTKGRYSGLEWEVGWRERANISQWYAQTKYTSPIGVSIQWNRATPNIVESKKYQYDDEYNLIEPDNFLKITMGVKF